MDSVVVDTNIFAAIFIGDWEMKKHLDSLLPTSNVVVSSVVQIELIQGAKNKSEVQRIEKYLSRFKLVHIDELISELALGLIRTYSKSHGLYLGDALVAATCLARSAALLTLNIKDFRFIPRLTLRQR
jgi:predicted nucleic acid-binding protein